MELTFATLKMTTTTTTAMRTTMNSMMRKTLENLKTEVLNSKNDLLMTSLEGFLTMSELELKVPQTRLTFPNKIRHFWFDQRQVRNYEINFLKFLKYPHCSAFT
jgi:hypothetical protein